MARDAAHSFRRLELKILRPRALTTRASDTQLTRPAP